MDIKKLFQNYLTKLENYQTIFQNQLNNLVIFDQRLNKLSSDYYSQNSFSSSHITSIKVEIKEIIVLLSMAIDTLNTNIKLLNATSLSLSVLPDEAILSYIVNETKIISFCESTYKKINASLLAVVSVITKIKNQTNDESDLSRC